MIGNYNSLPMTGITEQDYWTLEFHLREQLMALYATDLDDTDVYEEEWKHVGQILNNSWRDDITAREWLTVAGKELGVDTSNCVGG